MGWAAGIISATLIGAICAVLALSGIWDCACIVRPVIPAPTATPAAPQKSQGSLMRLTPVGSCHNIPSPILRV